MKYLVGLDVGTSNVKAVLFDTEGNELKASVHETVVMTSNKYYSEQDMMQVWEQCAGAIKDVVTCGIAAPEDILGIGFSGQGEGCWMIDKDGNPVQYASLWNDGRANELIPGLSEEQVKTFRLACTAPNPSATVLQLMWMKKNRPEAIEKATAQAKKNLIVVPMVEATIPHEVHGKFGRGYVYMMPAEEGTGVIAGGPVRAVMEAVGIKDIRTKSHGTSNPVNCVKAAIAGLSQLRTAEQVAALRGKTVEEIIGCGGMQWHRSK